MDKHQYKFIWISISTTTAVIQRKVLELFWCLRQDDNGLHSNIIIEVLGPVFVAFGPSTNAAESFFIWNLFHFSWIHNNILGLIQVKMIQRPSQIL